MNFSPLELEYLYHLVGNTSFNSFEENFSRFVQKEKLDEFRKANITSSTYKKLDNEISCM